MQVSGAITCSAPCYYSYIRVATKGKTGKATVLPGFCWIEHGSRSCGTPMMCQLLWRSFLPKIYGVGPTYASADKLRQSLWTETVVPNEEMEHAIINYLGVRKCPFWHKSLFGNELLFLFSNVSLSDHRRQNIMTISDCALQLLGIFCTKGTCKFWSTLIFCHHLNSVNSRNFIKKDHG